MSSLDPDTGYWSVTAQSISVAQDGSVWAVDSQGNLLQNTENRVAWRKAPGAATWIAVNQDSRMLCAIMKGQPFSSDLGEGEGIPLGPPPAELETIAVGTNPSSLEAEIWATDINHNVLTYHAISQTWTRQLVIGEQIVATPDGAVYRLDAGLIYQCNMDSSATWSPLPATAQKVASMSAAANGWLWAVGVAGSIYQFDGDQGWIDIEPPSSGTPVYVACGSDTTVWLLNGKDLYQFDPATNEWIPLTWTASGRPIQAAIATSKEAWAIDDQMSIYQYTENLDEWQTVTSNNLPQLRQVSAVDRQTLWGLDTAQKMHSLTCKNGVWQASNPRR